MFKTLILKTLEVKKGTTGELKESFRFNETSIDIKSSIK